MSARTCKLDLAQAQDVIKVRIANVRKFHRSKQVSSSALVCVGRRTTKVLWPRSESAKVRNSKFCTGNKLEK